MKQFLVPLGPFSKPLLRDNRSSSAVSAVSSDLVRHIIHFVRKHAHSNTVDSRYLELAYLE